MDNEISNVTKDYKQAYRMKEIIGAIFSFFIALILLIVYFFPLGKIADYPIENSFQIILSFLKNLIGKGKDSFSYLTYFVILAFAGLIVFIIFVANGISGFNKEADINKFYLNKNDLNLKISVKFVVKHAIILLVCILICALVIWPTKLVAKRYGFSFSLNWGIIIPFILFWTKGVVCGYVTLKYDEKGSESKQELLALNKKSEPSAKTKNKKKHLKVDTFLIKIHLLIIFVYIFYAVLGSIFLACSYYNAIFGGYNTLGFNSVAGWVVSPVGDDILTFDTKTLYGGGAHRLVCEEGFGDYYIGLDMKNDGSYESDTKTFTFYGDSYRYNYLKVKELEEKRNGLWPKGEGEKAFEKYLKEIEKLTNAIKHIQENLEIENYPYERVVFEEGFMVDLQYNSTGKDDIKWGKKVEGRTSFCFFENIKLTDYFCEHKKNMERFKLGTDFSKELIVARVQYNDGSVRISKIKPTNIEELNLANVGNHTLEWQDSWGEYQITITIY